MGLATLLGGTTTLLRNANQSYSCTYDSFNIIRIERGQQGSKRRKEYMKFEMSRKIVTQNSGN